MKRAISAVAALALAAAPAVASASPAASLSVAKAAKARAATPAAKKNGVLGAAAPVFVGLVLLGITFGVIAGGDSDSP